MSLICLSLILSKTTVLHTYKCDVHLLHSYLQFYDQIHEKEHVWQEIVANYMGNSKCLPMVLVDLILMFSFFILCTYIVYVLM